MSSFSDLHRKIANEDRFNTQLLTFLDKIIKCNFTPVDTNKVLFKIRLAELASEDASVIVSQLKYNVNLITSRLQIYFQTHNATCLKYDCNKTQYRFNFLWSIIPDSYIDNTKSIFLQRNNVLVNS